MTGSGRGREKRVEKGARSWELATGHGQRQSTPDTGSREASQDERGSSDSEEDRVKMSAFQLLCGIFASNPC